MNISVVVTSCDSFEDCWNPFISSLKTHWEKSNFEVYLISNDKKIDDERVHFIKVGKDKGWASNLKKALLQIDSEYIVYLQEDYFLTSVISDKIIEEHIEFMLRNDADYLRLSAPFYDRYQIEDSSYSYSPLTERYALCLQAAIWKKSALFRILIEGNSGWDFEYNIIDYMKKESISVKSFVLHSSAFRSLGISYVDGTAVRKGKWTVAGADFLERNGFCKLLQSRKKEGSVINFLMHRKNPLVHPFAAVLLRVINRYKLNF